MDDFWLLAKCVPTLIKLSVVADNIQTGYLPRVLIFNLQESSDCPLVILNEHTFGVSAVAFSPDNKYLASIGTPNDGFLYVWSINPRTGAARLHSSNKCTSFIRSMVWMGNNIITVGTRHVKVWRVDSGQSSSPSKQRFSPEGLLLPSTAQSTAIKTLSGRNCLLGALVETTFSCVASISDDVAVVCSEKGDICLLDDNDGQKLIKVGHAGFAVTCISANIERRLICIGGRGAMKTIGFDEVLKGNTPTESPSAISYLSSSQLGSGTLYAIALATEICIAVNSEHAITVSKIGIISDAPTPLTAHCDPVLGVRLLYQPNTMAADFFTWSSTGEVLFWDLQGCRTGSMQIEIEQSLVAEDGSPNQCQIIRSSPSASFFVSGDKHGVLRILEGIAHNCTLNTKAHGSDIQDIAIHEGEKSILVASCGRDRTVQLFRKRSEWTLLQTMDEHTAACCSLFFCDGGNSLVSASTDRTIQIRQLASREVNGQEVVAMIPTRVITLKASPVSMTLSSTDRINNLVVSLLDRTIATYDLASGKLINSFRATDNEGNDAVVMDALVMGKPSPLPGRPTILAGVSSTDKSVRIYDGITGTFVDREWGHTSAVTDLALLESADLDKTTLISTGADGTIMIWEVSPRSTSLPDVFEPNGDARDESPTKEATSIRPPLRRVLSKAELAEFQRPSPASTPTGRGSPPRSLRRKTSKYSMSTQSPKPAMPSIPAVTTAFPPTTSQDLESRKGSSRTRSRSPPSSPKSRVSRRPSLASLEFRGRTKSAGNFSEFGTLNMATEQVCRTLRAYQKKLTTNELIRESLLQELDQELRLTAKALGEKTLKTKAMSESVLAGLLDQYSERLVSIFDEKLRLSLSTNILDAGSALNGAASPSVIHSDTGRLE
jgi:WD40 repeat protein